MKIGRGGEEKREEAKRQCVGRSDKGKSWRKVDGGLGRASIRGA